MSTPHTSASTSRAGSSCSDLESEDEGGSGGWSAPRATSDSRGTRASGLRQPPQARTTTTSLLHIQSEDRIAEHQLPQHLHQSRHLVVLKKPLFRLHFGPAKAHHPRPLSYCSFSAFHQEFFPPSDNTILGVEEGYLECQPQCQSHPPFVPRSPDRPAARFRSRLPFEIPSDPVFCPPPPPPLSSSLDVVPLPVRRSVSLPCLSGSLFSVQPLAQLEERLRFPFQPQSQSRTGPPVEAMETSPSSKAMSNGLRFQHPHIQELRSQVTFPPHFSRGLSNPPPKDPASRSLMTRLSEAQHVGTLDKLQDQIDANSTALVDILFGDGGLLSAQRSKHAHNLNLANYLVIFVSDLISVSDTFCKAVLAQQEPYKPILSLVKNESVFDSLLSQLAINLLTELLEVDVRSRNPRAETVVPFVYNHLAKFLGKRSAPDAQVFAASQYCKILGNPDVRTIFWRGRKERLDPLVEILQQSSLSGPPSTDTLALASSSSNLSARFAHQLDLSGNDVGTDLAYWIVRVLWQLSFNAEEFAEQMQRDYDILALCKSLLRRSYPRVINVVLGLLINLLTFPHSPLLSAASLSNLVTAIPDPNRTINTSIYDRDALEDMNTLVTTLHEYAQSHTTLDDYIQEIESGDLKWTPPHRSTEFWNQNAQAVFDYKSGSLVNSLANILLKRKMTPETDGRVTSLSTEPDKEISNVARCIACTDLLQIMRRVPESRIRLNNLEFVRRNVMVYTVEEPDRYLRQLCLDLLTEWYRDVWSGGSV